MGHSRDIAAAKKAYQNLLQYLRREPTAMHRIGPISLWFCGGYPIERVEELMERLVAEGILRHATPDELRANDYRHGYFVTEVGLERLPPEDRSYGAVK